MSRTLQFRRLGTATLANTTGANGELIINTTNKTLTVHDGVTPGGFIVTGNTSTSIDQFARNTANSATTSAQAATNLAQSAYNYANTLTVSAIDQYARNEANAAVIASTSALNENIILRGVDDTQNTNISNAANLAQAAFDAANTANGGGVTGNISIVSTNSAINFVANSSGDGVGYSTIQLVPDTNSFSDQYIVIDPTAPSHIHVRAGGIQDSSGAQLFLGGEKQYVRVTDNQGIRLQNEETNDNFYYYSNTVQYVSGTWYEEGGNYFIQFTTNDSQMVTDLSNFASGSPNQVILYWNNGVETISNTMISPTSFWQGIGNVYTAQVSETLPANNTTLTAIEFHLFTTQTNYVGLENNDFTVNVYDDVRINARDYFSLRNWSTTSSIEIVTDYDNQSHAWEFGANGTLETPGDIIVSGDVTGRDGVNTLVLKAQPNSNTSIQLNDTVDSIISTSANLEIRTDVNNVPYVWTFENNGTITFPDSSSQTTAYTGIGTDQYARDTANTKLNLTGGTITGNLVVNGKSTLSGVAETFSGLVDATGVVVHDCSTGRIFNHTSIDNNFTANFTNLNLNSGEATTVTLVLNQGGTAYIANSVQIGGVTQTIRWSANTVPTGNTNAVDVQSFSILNSSGTYTVLGQLSTFG